MKTFVQKITAMSLILILSCATVVAQNEKDTKDEYKNISGITLKSNIKLKSGETKIFPITIFEGYYKPFLIYISNHKNMIANTFIKEARSFSAKIQKEGENYNLKITAKDVNKTDTDTLNLRAIKKNPQRIVSKENKTKEKSTLSREERLAKSMKENPYFWGFPVKITVTPK